MDSSTSDSFLTSDYNTGPVGNYNTNSDRISPIAIFLILILLIMLIGFFLNNLSTGNTNINNFEPNLEKYKPEHKAEHKSEHAAEHTAEHTAEHKAEQKQNVHNVMHPSLIKKSLHITNQELNNSINKLADLVNATSSEIRTDNNQEIKDLEKRIDDLKSEMIILQSKLLDNELHKPEEKPTNKPHQVQTPNINITTDRVNPPVSYTYNNFQDDVVIYDPIANYDRLKLTDPLVDPRGRSSADQIPTPQVAAQLNFPTQGVLDRYHRVGLLIALDNDEDGSVYYDKTNRFDDFYGNQNNKSNNILETNSDYSEASYYPSNSPTYSADTQRKYNGVEIANNLKNNSRSNSNTNTTTNPYSNPYSNPNPNPYSNPNNDSIFTTSAMSVSSVSSPKPLSSSSSKSKAKKHHKHKKHSHQKENFEIEGFTNETNYENFESGDDNNDVDADNVDYNTDIYSNPDSVPGDGNYGVNLKKKYPYFDKYDYELDAGSDLNNFEDFNSTEGFGNLNGGNNQHKKRTTNIANVDNGILELIGKKITDNWYKYFTSISVGNKIIKINVHNRNRRELYDGDIVYISELGKRYRVKIDKMDMIEYNPYFF